MLGSAGVQAMACCSLGDMDKAKATAKLEAILNSSVCALTTARTKVTTCNEDLLLLN